MKKHLPIFLLSSFLFLGCSSIKNAINVGIQDYKERKKSNDTKQVLSKEDKRNIKINNLISLELLMNYELTRKNYNLATVIDYIPNNISEKVKNINFQSNLGGTIEDIDFIYDEKNRISNINYTVDRKEGRGAILFKYTLNYDGNLLKNITIKDKPKYFFNYENTKLKSISYNFRGVEYLYNVVYNYPEKKAELRKNVTRNGKTYEFTNELNGEAEDKIYWNDNMTLKGFSYGIYTTNILQYNKKGNIDSFNFKKVSSKPSTKWTYKQFDEKGNWTQRTSKELFINRKITY